MIGGKLKSTKVKSEFDANTVDERIVDIENHLKCLVLSLEQATAQKYIH